MKKTYDILIFDLDGTLIDTSEGIFNSVRYAQRKLGLYELTRNELELFIGPPPEKMYKKMYNISDELAKTATKLHREYGLKFGIYEAKLYKNIINCLMCLKESGYLLGVATLKNEMAAKEILKYFKIDIYFDVICGMGSSENSTKAQLISSTIEQLGGGKALMVGDSVYDQIGAMEAKVDFAAVLYGFGFKVKPKDVEKSLNDISELLQILNLDIGVNNGYKNNKLYLNKRNN